MKIFKFIIGFVFILIINSCNNIYVNNYGYNKDIAGVCLTFDDLSVNEWYGLSFILKDSSIKASFFVTKPNLLSESKFSKLYEMQYNGFEIGYHGYHHINANEYLETHNLSEYFDYEIKPGLDLLAKHNIFPKSFSFPSGMDNDSLDIFLLKFFTHFRDVTDIQRHPLSIMPHQIDDIYHTKGEYIYKALGIDKQFNISKEEIYNVLKKAKDEKKIVILYAHIPVKQNAIGYQINIDYIQYIISVIKKLNLKTYTLNEL